MLSGSTAGPPSGIARPVSAGRRLSFLMPAGSRPASALGPRGPSGGSDSAAGRAASSVRSATRAMGPSPASGPWLASGPSFGIELSRGSLAGSGSGSSAPSKGSAASCAESAAGRMGKSGLVRAAAAMAAAMGSSACEGAGGMGGSGAGAAGSSRRMGRGLAAGAAARMAAAMGSPPSPPAASFSRASWSATSSRATAASDGSSLIGGSGFSAGTPIDGAPAASRGFFALRPPKSRERNPRRGAPSRYPGASGPFGLAMASRMISSMVRRSAGSMTSRTPNAARSARSGSPSARSGEAMTMSCIPPPSCALSRAKPFRSDIE